MESLGHMCGVCAGLLFLNLRLTLNLFVCARRSTSKEATPVDAETASRLARLKERKERKAAR